MERLVCVNSVADIALVRVVVDTDIVNGGWIGHEFFICANIGTVGCEEHLDIRRDLFAGGRNFGKNRWLLKHKAFSASQLTSSPSGFKLGNAAYSFAPVNLEAQDDS